MFYSTCTPIGESVTIELDMSNFFQKLADNIAFVVQFNKVNRPEAYHTIDDVSKKCYKMFNILVHMYILMVFFFVKGL